MDDEILRPVVDDHDRFLRCETRAAIMAASLPHRTIWGMVYSPLHGLWLAQWRRPDKDICPNLWDMACGGHVDRVDNTPESYAEAYRRELLEELGLTTTFRALEALSGDPPATFGEPVSVDIGHSIEYHNYPTSWGERLLEREQVRMFLTLYDGGVALRPDAEPQAIAWLSASSIRAEVLAAGRGTVALDRMLERCQAVLGRMGFTGGMAAGTE